MLAECEKLAREAAARNEPYDALPAATDRAGSGRPLGQRPGRPASAPPASRCSRTSTPSTSPPRPTLPKQKVLELARGEWIEQHFNCCLIGSAGTGKTHVATALGLAAVPARQAGPVLHRRRAGHPPGGGPAAAPPRPLPGPAGPARPADRATNWATCRSAGSGAELLFQVFADRYERRSLLITSNLPFGEWGQVFQGERMTAALLDRLTHRCHIFEMNGESYRFRESMKAKKDKDPKKGK